jgi:hypothetical protein
MALFNIDLKGPEEEVILGKHNSKDRTKLSKQSKHNQDGAEKNPNPKGPGIDEIAGHKV